MANTRVPVINPHAIVRNAAGKLLYWPTDIAKVAAAVALIDAGIAGLSACLGHAEVRETVLARLTKAEGK